MSALTVVLFIAALVLLGGAALFIARSGARHHPESLNTHPDDEREPVRDRPAGPGAEAMAVDAPGEPGLVGDADARQRPK